MSEHQLHDADVDAVRKQTTRAFVTQIVPVQIDPPERLAIDASTRFRALRVVSVGHQLQRFPGRLEAVLEFAVG